MKIKQSQLLRFCEPRLHEKFGKNTMLGKFELSPQDKFKCTKNEGEKPVWSILTLGSKAFSFKIHGTGNTPQSALKCAGLEGWIKDAEDSFSQEASHVN